MQWKAQSLGEVLARQARGRGTVEALVTPNRRITYEDLYLRSRSAATTLHTLGLGRGDHVGILMGNDEKWLALFYGAALIGAVTVPVNTRFKTPEIEFCLRRSGCKALFYAGKFLNIDFAAMLREVRVANLQHVLTYEELPTSRQATSASQVMPVDPLLIQFTSGTTAYPKGVVLTHDSMLRDAWTAGERIGVRP